MRVRVVRTAEGLRELEAPWDALLRDSPFQAPFHSWAWHEAWWNAFNAGSELFLIAAEDADGHLQVLAPFVKGKAYVRGLRVSEIRFLAHSITPYNTILHRSGCSGAEALATVLACLNGHRCEWDMVNLWNVPAAASVLPCLDEVGEPCGLHAIRHSGIRSAYIAIEGDFEKYMTDDARKSRRRGIVQKVRQLSQRPGYEVRAFTRPEEMEQALELAFAVSQASWKGKLGTHMTGLEARRSFYANVTPRLARRGEVGIFISTLEQTPIALEYLLISKDTVYFIVNDFNESYQKQSPGTVLLYHVLGELFQERKFREFYFSGDLYDYKTNWATGVREHVNLEIFHDRPYSRFLWWAKKKAMPGLRKLRADIPAAVKHLTAG